jgi:hypothetical protein
MRNVVCYTHEYPKENRIHSDFLNFTLKKLGEQYGRVDPGIWGARSSQKNIYYSLLSEFHEISKGLNLEGEIVFLEVNRGNNYNVWNTQRTNEFIIRDDTYYDVVIEFPNSEDAVLFKLSYDGTESVHL